jgi:hypothetical protein
MITWYCIEMIMQWHDYIMTYWCVDRKTSSWLKAVLALTGCFWSHSWSCKFLAGQVLHAYILHNDTITWRHDYMIMQWNDYAMTWLHNDIKTHQPESLLMMESRFHINSMFQRLLLIKYVFSWSSRFLIDHWMI